MHHGHSLGALLGVEVGSVPQGAGVHRHERELVREHVVHLAGDAGALVLAGLSEAQLLLGVAQTGALPQRGEQLAAAADGPADRHDGGGERGEQAEEPGLVARLGRRSGMQVEGLDDDEADEAGGDHRADLDPAAAGGDRHEHHQRGDPAEAREAGDEGGGDTHRERRHPPQRQQHDRDEAHQHVGDHEQTEAQVLGVRRLGRGARAEDDRPQHRAAGQRQQHSPDLAPHAPPHAPIRHVPSL
nr:hypothetical protein [Arenivirga flava]